MKLRKIFKDNKCLKAKPIYTGVLLLKLLVCITAELCLRKYEKSI